jgi:hypothetical protein
MRAFAEAWPDEAFVQAVLAQITWYHNLAILEKLAAAEEDRIWYAKALRHYNLGGAAPATVPLQIQVQCTAER